MKMTHFLHLTLLNITAFLGLVVANSNLTNDIYSELDTSSISSNVYDHSFCPDPEDIAPCICERDCPACQSRIVCCNIQNIEQLNEAFQKSGDLPFKNVNFCNLTIMYFPSASFISKQFRSIYMFNNTQVSLFDEPPSSNSILYSLYLHSIHLQRSIQWELFSAFRELTMLSIVDVPLRRLKNEIGEILPKQIGHITLQHLNTEVLDDNVFAPLKKLSYLGLSHNVIKTVKRSMFPKPFIGTMISLDHNKIETLPDDFLEDMTSITGLELSYNLLTTVAKSVFKNRPSSLRAIFFEGNPINCDCKMKWLTEQPMIYLGGQCVSPGHNKGKYLSTLQESDFPQC